MQAPERFHASARWRDIESAFHRTGDATAVLAALTGATDEIVRHAIERILPAGAVAFAVGAYGRSEIFPCSSAEIVVVAGGAAHIDLPRHAGPSLRLVCSTRNVTECVDIREQNYDLAVSLLDRRFLGGNPALGAQIEERLSASLPRSAKKIALRMAHSARVRHARYGNTAGLLEPDVKDAPGGLSDLRLVDSLRKLLADLEAEEGLAEAARTLAAIRCYLHYRAARDLNVLDTDAQATLGAPPFSLPSSSYWAAARLVHNATRRTLESVERGNSSLLHKFGEYRSRLSNSEFTVARDRVLLRSPGRLDSDPEVLLRLLEFVARHGVLPAPDTERRIERSRATFAAWSASAPIFWPGLKNILTAPFAVAAWRTAVETGIGAALLPAWEQVENLPAASPGRRFTAGEHALRALQAVANLRTAADRGAQRFAIVISEIDSAATLSLAILLADAEPCAAPAGMSMEEAETLAFLHNHQDELTYDVADATALAALAHRVGTVERLKLLTIATYAEIAADEGAANAAFRLDRLWKLYGAVHEELTRELEAERIETPPAELTAATEFVQGFPSRYVRAHSAAEIESHFHLYERSRPTGAAVDFEAVEGDYRLVVVARDRPYLFASFAAAISSFGFSVVKAEAFSNKRGVILDLFVFADPKRVLQLNPAEVGRLKDTVQRVAFGRTDAQRLMRGLQPPEPRKRSISPVVRFDSLACDAATLVEITAEDRPGLLYRLAEVFSSSACNIDVVLIDTKGNRAIDVFYVAYDGRKLSPEMESRLYDKLVAAC